MDTIEERQKEKQRRINQLIAAAESVVEKAEANKHISVPLTLGWALGTLKRTVEEVKRSV